MSTDELERALRHFEGLVKETASQIVAGGVELDFDDVRQLLRVKVWHAVLKFDEGRAADGRRMRALRDRHGRTQMERFVFMCVANMRKDIEKRPRRYNQSVEEQRADRFDRDRFDARYLSVDADQVFAQIEEEDTLPLPSTLTEIERQVIALRMEGWQFQEIDRELGLSRAQRERAMQSVREKLADWRPSATPHSAPTPALLDDAPPAPPSPVALAA